MIPVDTLDNEQLADILDFKVELKAGGKRREDGLTAAQVEAAQKVEANGSQ